MQKRRKTAPKKETALGNLEPMHRFFLNPYTDARFTYCPECDRKMKDRKRPFLVHVDPMQLIIMNMTTKYCPDDDLIIMHRDILESFLVQITNRRGMQELIGNDYLVIGTMERAYFRDHIRGKADDRVTFDHLHDFAEHVRFEPVANPSWQIR